MFPCPRSAFSLAVLFLVCIPAFCAAAPRGTPTGLLIKTIKHDGADRRYTLFVPPDYDRSKKWPLIVFLNGAGECGTDGLKSAAVGLGPAVMLDVAHWPFLVLVPQKPEVRDQWEQYDGMVMAMLDRTKKDYSVDTSRLYLTGLSQGGHGTWAIGALHADLWAAIAPICGYGNPSDYAERLKGMPVWAFHGEADPVVPMKQSQDMVAAINAAGGQAKLTTYPGAGHNSWDNAYRNEKLPDWFLKHQRKS